jgi:small GTP-binding protein
MSTRSGFLSFVGRPNVGKSTLMNALIGEKVAITSSKPQTTRKTIRGIVTRGEGQLIIVDTPDALLITTKEHAQSVKNIVETLKNSGHGDVL